jgi:hypothetical protein
MRPALTGSASSFARRTERCSQKSDRIGNSRSTQPREKIMQATRRIGLIAIGMIALSQPAAADVIADWNEKAVTFVLAHHMGPPPAERIMAMTHVAMFDAVNSIERRYRP